MTRKTVIEKCRNIAPARQNLMLHSEFDAQVHSLIPFHPPFPSSPSSFLLAAFVILRHACFNGNHRSRKNTFYKPDTVTDNSLFGFRTDIRTRRHFAFRLRRREARLRGGFENRLPREKVSVKTQTRGKEIKAAGKG